MWRKLTCSTVVGSVQLLCVDEGASKCAAHLVEVSYLHTCDVSHVVVDLLFLTAC